MYRYPNLASREGMGDPVGEGWVVGKAAPVCTKQVAAAIGKRILAATDDKLKWQINTTGIIRAGGQSTTCTPVY